jgi:hypothetical protein
MSKIWFIEQGNEPHAKGSTQKQCITHSKGTKTYISKVGFFNFILLGIPTWGVGFSPKHVTTKVKKDEDIIGLIQGSKVAYAKAFKGAWDNQIWKNTSNKMVW